MSSFQEVKRHLQRVQTRCWLSGIARPAMLPRASRVSRVQHTDSWPVGGFCEPGAKESVSGAQGRGQACLGAARSLAKKREKGHTHAADRRELRHRFVAPAPAVEGVRYGVSLQSAARIDGRINRRPVSGRVAVVRPAEASDLPACLPACPPARLPALRSSGANESRSARTASTGVMIS